MVIEEAKNLNYVAKHAVMKGLHDAVRDLERSIEQTAGLTHKDAKLDDSGKQYFADKQNEYKEAVKQVRALIAHVDKSNDLFCRVQ